MTTETKLPDIQRVPLSNNQIWRTNSGRIVLIVEIPGKEPKFGFLWFDNVDKNWNVCSDDIESKLETYVHYMHQPVKSQKGSNLAKVVHENCGQLEYEYAIITIDGGSKVIVEMEYPCCDVFGIMKWYSDYSGFDMKDLKCEMKVHKFHLTYQDGVDIENKMRNERKG